MSSDTIVVVGASAAGVAAAMGAREAGWDGEIVVVGDEPHEPYERPPLSKSLLTGAEPHAKRLLTSERAAELELRLLLGRSVVDLDPARGTAVLDDGEPIPAKGVVLATGSRPRTLPHLDGPGVLQLRTLTDATSLVACLETATQVAVVGGGFIGLEVAAAARARGSEVTVIEVAPTPLLHIGDPTIGEWFRERHTERGVRIVTSRQVTELRRGDDGMPTELVLDDGSRVAAQLVVVGVGVTPRTELAERAGVAVTGGVIVDETGRSSSPWLYAAGDVAVHTVDGQLRRVEHWTVAAEQGLAAGRSIAGVRSAWCSVPYFWSDQFEFMLQLFGVPRAGDIVVTRRMDEGAACWFWLRDGTVSAAAGVNAREVRIGRQLVAARTPVDPATLADDGVDLRSLLRR